mgnify:CR=1 FL=1
MRYVHSAPLYAVVAAALVGCGKDAPVQDNAVSGLENTVMAEQVANVSKKEELDLSTPEKAITYLRNYMQDSEFPITKDQFLAGIKSVSTKSFYERNAKSWERHPPTKEGFDRMKQTRWKIDRVTYTGDRKAVVRVLYDFPDGKTEGEQFTLVKDEKRWLVEKD